ncbi:MAG: hypothetical protein A3C35_07015 [Omnitrophica bacterium RIFCSPHIGHO2_02_FULL_46_11]|nr:MAG: hypothetical protein A3A81_06835 [Omnitrophica bacterium RIFCSPLOWO2_01_FULL_45_10b]OGW87235.1 MAG: hypothetical protein A3C35_07015 [Omnitrophica bacterium RIFCSPHIGHO2_02_FULL_46_11]
MSEETGYFSSFDGTKLFYRTFEHAAASRALIIVHGFGEHSGRYLELIEAVRSLPLSIFLFDLRGHGQSEGERVYADSFRYFVDDAEKFRQFLEARYPRIHSFILMGQSFGGLIASALVLKNSSSWVALILLSPFFSLPKANRFLHWFSLCLNMMIPKIVWNNPIQPAFLTHDSAELEHYQQDSLIQRRITTRLTSEMFKAGKSVFEKAGEVALPVLILASGDDHIVSLEKTKGFFERISSIDKKMQIFDGFYHELLHEKDRQKPIGILRDYLSSLV